MTRKWSIFKMLSLICPIYFSYDLNIMHAWGTVDLRAYLAKKKDGYSIPAQSYDFCPHLTQLDILDFTLSHTEQRGSGIIILVKIKDCEKYKIKYFIHAQYAT